MSSLGFKVLGESRGFTKSHQIAINVLEYSDGGKESRRSWGLSG